MRGIIAGAVRAVSVLKRAVTGVDYPGLSWRRLRGFQRGTQCLADCGEGHTFEIGCALGPNWHGVLAEILFPLPRRASELNIATRRAIHAALTEVALVDTAGDVADRLTGPQRVRAKLREQGLASTGGDSPQWRLPENWPDLSGLPYPCCGGPHTASEGNPYGHAVDCEHYGRSGPGVYVAPGVMVHPPSCASVEDAEGKAGPCDCGGQR